jgi:RNA polymerase sigma-70 factor, ECF subfamily
MTASPGDEAAFERLYRAHVGRVYALCLRMSGDPVHAEQLVQDVFVQAWRRLGTFAGHSAFSTWLHRLAVNVVLMDRRAAGRRERRVQTTDDPIAAEGPGREPPAGLRLDLERAIAALPEGAREVFLLHDVEGYRHEEIAEIVGIAVGTSKAQLFRARRLLREKLE